jgi:type II secretory pathway component PulF
MKTFQYRGYDRQGVGVRGVLESPDLKGAREALVRKGILTDIIIPATEIPRQSGRFDFGAEVRAVFYHELGVLLEAGVPMVQALTLIIQSPDLGAAQGLLGGVRDQVREGAGLAHALAELKNVQDFETAVLEAGEKSGSLGPILIRLSGFLQEQQSLRDRVKSVMIYPMIVLGFALLMAVILLGFVIPSAAHILTADAGIQLPALTRMMIGVGRVLIWGVIPFTGVVVCCVWLLRRRFQTGGIWSGTLDPLIFRLPWIGPARVLVANLRFCRTLGLLLKGGVPLLSSLELAGRSTGSVWIAGMARQGLEELRQGISLAEVLRRIPPLSESLPGWVQTGEASGALDRMLETAGDHYQHRWNRSVTRLLSWLEPALILLIGAFVLLVVLSVLLPVLALNQTLK